MKFHFSQDLSPYSGHELRPLHSYMKYGLLGDSMVAWCGPCDVKLSEMVDGEDRRANAKICGDLMLHFLVEIFDTNLFSAVALQRLLATMVLEAVETLAEQNQNLNQNEKRLRLRRDGDDVYWGEKKLSISIATSSATSELIHFAVNVVNKGTPVPTAALEDFKIQPNLFAKRVGERFVAEVDSIRAACRKVFPLS